MKKIFSLFTSLVMVISLVGLMPAMSVGAATSGDYEYTVLSYGTVKITKYKGSAKELDIPSEIDGKAVTSIGDWAFYHCSSLTSITIPNSVTSIGDHAFSDCSSLTSITIPDSVTSIGVYAFFCCESLTSINVDSNNAYYSSKDGVLFDKDKTELIQYPEGKRDTSYSIPNGVTSIGSSAFEYCESLTSITIPDSVTSIGDYAFDGCSRLTSITIPNSVTSIVDFAFSRCSSLTSITIPNSVKTIGESAFQDCENLTSLNIPNSVTSIGGYAFLGCSSLTSITIPNSVTSIESYAFGYCESLTAVTIPKSVTSIDYDAFYYCKSLKDVYYSGSEEEWNKIKIDSANSYLTNATIHYNWGHLLGKVYHQTKTTDEETALRFVAELDTEDLQNAETGSYTIDINNESLTNEIKKVYKSIYVNGEKYSAPEGKYFVTSTSLVGVSEGTTVSVEFELSNYDYGLKKEVTI